MHAPSDLPASRHAFYVPDGGALLSTGWTRGPWTAEHQHGGPPSALLARALETQAAAEDMRVARFGVELLRPVPIAPLTVETTVVRQGRKVRVHGAALYAGTTELCRATALLVRRLPLAVSTRVSLAEPLPEPARCAPLEISWMGGEVSYAAAMETLRVRGTWGQGALAAWMRMRVPLVEGESPSALQRVLVAADAGSGLAAALDMSAWTFLNADLTVFLHRPLEGEWVGLDARTAVGDEGIALTDTTLHDVRGPIGRSLQTLVVEPRRLAPDPPVR